MQSQYRALHYNALRGKNATVFAGELKLICLLASWQLHRQWVIGLGVTVSPVSYM